MKQEEERVPEADEVTHPYGQAIIRIRSAQLAKQTARQQTKTYQGHIAYVDCSAG